LLSNKLFLFGMKKNISFIIYLLITNFYVVIAQEKLLKSGPMVGYSSMREVLLWVQTTEKAKVHFEYLEINQPQTKQKSEIVETQKEKGFVAKIIVPVLPDKKYEYQLFINNKLVKRPYPLQFQSQSLWQWRKEPPTIKFAIGSCNFVNEELYDRPGKPYGSGYEIFNTILAQKPDFMVWMGDNTYLREADWDSRTGILYRYTHTRSLKEMQALLGSVHHYATWDDHDYGPNDSDRTYEHKETTKEIFELFWGNPNAKGAGGISNKLSWGDIDIFLLDGRWFRTPDNYKGGKPEMLGKQQLEWLLESLKSSNATFKFVVSGSQILNDVEDDRLELFSKYKEEYNEFLRRLQIDNVSGIFFLTGDRHSTDLSMMKREGKYPLYDLTVSPLTAGAVGDRAKSEKNSFRVPDTYVGENNFGILEITGKRKERILKITIFNKDGKELWNKEIKAQELR
jgi:alkaline phosphatase D